ncbi:sialate O-acetylesterase [Parapedobacter sp. SGR-10]|uniref:sialate O-acetylesterase n=1 Tax=Parapedobacter sp. SGR-10 TaxID=2710879 RepID=UPI0013D72811|nr:sialate O-acetylesterase [Parapedobacter sp. SGR-10]NGF56443.1 sialate O-acetylesterase [Parapedobacter sp. SGR-10]
MEKIKSVYVFKMCLMLLLLPCSVSYAQQVEKILFGSLWKTLDRNWVNTSKGGSNALIVRKDMREDTLWEQVSMDFRMGEQATGRYMFGVALNAKDHSRFGLIRLFTNNNVTNLQAGVWEYGYFRVHMNTPIGNVLVPGGTYRVVIEPNLDRKDWRPWVVRLINAQDGKILFEKTIVNTMPLFGMGIAGIYNEGADVEFLDYAVKIVPEVNVSNALRLAPLFKPGMVLQRDKKILVWGYADSNTDVTVSIAGKKYIANADAVGKWNTLIGPLAAMESTQMIVTNGKSNVILNNVAVGEVWLASGQSNMEMRIWQSDVGKQYGVRQDQGIRVFMQPGWPSEDPLFNSGGKWIGTDDADFETSSAVAYSFASELRNRLKVPVGIICSYWGGTGAESWVRRDAMRHDAATLPLIQDYEAAGEALRERKKVIAGQFAPGQHKAPGILFNGMIYPHVPYGIQGVLWYQGESNANRATQYHTLFPMLIHSWREAWKDPEMPFYFVQLPNYDGGQSGADIPNAWPAIREAQRLTLQKVPYTGMAITMELGNPQNIHPFLKQEIGLRLSRLALHDVYGFKDIVRSGPLFKSVRFEKGQAFVHFDEVAEGLKLRKGQKLQGFVIAGEDRKFIPAQAVVDKDGNGVIVHADGMKNPVAVRYAWANSAEDANLVNNADLPASPFRTDDWELFDQ